MARASATLDGRSLPASKLAQRAGISCQTASSHLAKLTEDQLIAAMAKHPIIVERPIVVSGGKAALGRPPEAVLAVL